MDVLLAVGLCSAVIGVLALAMFARFVLAWLTESGCIFWIVVIVLLCSGIGLPFGLILLILYAIRPK